MEMRASKRVGVHGPAPMVDPPRGTPRENTASPGIDVRMCGYILDASAHRIPRENATARPPARFSHHLVTAAASAVGPCPRLDEVSIARYRVPTCGHVLVVWEVS